MNVKKFLTGTLAGTIDSFIVAYIIFKFALHSYFGESRMEGVTMEVPDLPWVVIGHICMSAALTYIFIKWANVKTVMAGLNGGLIIGLLTSLGYGLIDYGTSNVFSSVIPALVEAFAGGIVWAAGGAAIGWALSLGNDWP